MNVLIITPCGLPVPAVKGGAVSTLVESIVKENEIKNEMNLSVVSSFDSKAKKESDKYKKTKFIFIKEPKVVKCVDALYEFFINKIFRIENDVKKRYLWKIFIINKLKKFLKENEYDKIVIENSGYLLNVFRNKKIFNKYVGKIYYHLHNDVPNNININILKKTKIMIISEYLKKKIIKMCGEEIEKNIFILRNGFCCNRFNKKITENDKKTLRDNLRIDHNKKVIIFVGRIVKEKGIRELLDAFKLLENEEYRLLIVGDVNFGIKQSSSFLETIKKEIYNLKEKVIFTGYVPYEDIFKYYQCADVAVLPSIWNEPAGLTMIEAIASGVPLLTTNTGGIPEYLSNEYVNFINVDKHIVQNIKKSIIEIFNDIDENKRKASIGSKFVSENYTEENLYNNFFKLLLN